MLFKIINIVIFAVQTVDFDVTICLPPGGRGTVEAVEGGRAIELECKFYLKNLIWEICLNETAPFTTRIIFPLP